MLTQTLAPPTRSKRPKVDGKAKYAVLKAVAEALSAKTYPPLDERLKSIVATQVGSLLKGGWKIADVQRAAIELALAWDEKRGHNRLSHLAARVRIADADRQRAQHLERDRIERQELATGAPKGSTMRHPNLHDFESDGRGSCRICTGPIGVHVKTLVLEETL